MKVGQVKELDPPKVTASKDVLIERKKITLGPNFKVTDYRSEQVRAEK